MKNLIESNSITILSTNCS